MTMPKPTVDNEGDYTAKRLEEFQRRYAERRLKGQSPAVDAETTNIPVAQPQAKPPRTRVVAPEPVVNESLDQKLNPPSRANEIIVPQWASAPTPPAAPTVHRGSIVQPLANQGPIQSSDQTEGAIQRNQGQEVTQTQGNSLTITAETYRQDAGIVRKTEQRVLKSRRTIRNADGSTEVIEEFDTTPGAQVTERIDFRRDIGAVTATKDVFQRTEVHQRRESSLVQVSVGFFHRDPGVLGDFMNFLKDINPWHKVNTDLDNAIGYSGKNDKHWLVRIPEDLTEEERRKMQGFADQGVKIPKRYLPLK